MSDSEINPYAPPAANVLLADDRAPFDPGARLKLAGGLMLVNAALVLVQGIVMHDVGVGSPGSGFLPTIIDVLIAGSFLSGNEKYRGFAIFRVTAGMLLFGGLQIAQGNFIDPVLALFGYGGLLLILIGQPPKVRQIVGAVLFGLMALVQLAAILLVGFVGPS